MQVCVSMFNEAILTVVKMWKDPNIYWLKRKCILTFEVVFLLPYCSWGTYMHAENPTHIKIKDWNIEIKLKKWCEQFTVTHPCTQSLEGDILQENKYLKPRKVYDTNVSFSCLVFSDSSSTGNVAFTAVILYKNIWYQGLVRNIQGSYHSC